MDSTVSTVGAPRRSTVLGSVAAVVALVATSVALAPPAHAETRTVVDEGGEALQGPAYQLLSGTMTYTHEQTKLTARIQRVSKERTWVGGSVYYADDSMLRVITTYRDGRRVTRGTFFTAGGSQTSVPVTSRWDLARDRVTMTVDNTAHDPKPGNERALLDVYTVTKGWMHGPHCDVRPNGELERCNDDYVSARLSR
ncbi:hypothetical protein G7072_05980 [Nocardioides sp. HDW12B]|uniref:hypothetical protein n=1 Tax=Nocardioides sp. HDW12B TaxID=2714939 RepID=UPI00140E0FCE|nr:hypothetical protein [Nocardioides sp. HDW12B]QIK65945.1 hypothetical protein G7072_05980 [Nocardioides sp. HDW12B]